MSDGKLEYYELSGSLGLADDNEYFVHNELFYSGYLFSERNRGRQPFLESCEEVYIALHGMRAPARA